MRHAENHYLKTPTLCGNLPANKTNQNAFSGLLAPQPDLNSSRFREMSHLFKMPKFDALPNKKATVKSILSPSRRVQAGRVRNDTKISQQSKMSFLPRASYINPNRKSLHYSRTNQVNSRKEIIKKMVYLAECALKENLEIKQSTPIKLPAGLTPRKTPRSRGFLVLPEFKKRGEKAESKTPIRDVIRTPKPCSPKPTPLFVSDSKSFSLENKLDSEECKENEMINLVNLSSNNKETYSRILHSCQNYNTQVSDVYRKLKSLEDCFQNNIANLPDCLVYDEFCLYQSKKEELYNELKLLEETLKESMKSQGYVANKLKEYVNKRQELFEKGKKLLKDFEEVVNSAMIKCEDEKKEEEKVEKEEKAEEQPMLRRSLRLSKIPRKHKIEEKTPMTRKLKKLDNKSKTIRKGGK